MLRCMANRTRKGIMNVLFRRRGLIRDGGTSTGIGEPSIYHALVIIFLEFFAWGLLTVPIINVLAETFPTNKFLMNGVILGIKGLLSFLSAPLIGSLSDIWGRKFFLLLTVFCTCMPIPLLRFSPWWYFALFSMSGIFSVTFSVVLAYVADITDTDERNASYGLVSATFGASLVISPALGAYISEAYSDEACVAAASAIAALDVFFIMVAVPESLPVKLRQSWDSVPWETVDPFASLKLVGEDRMVVFLCIIVFLSYLPEAGQFSCFFVYLKLIVGFSPEAVAAFIGLVGVMSVLAQTGLLMMLQGAFGTKNTIMIGLFFQFVQLVWYGIGTKYWMMWAAGVLVAVSQITYPSISSFISINSDKDKQGTVQGIVTGIRGLCTGLGPAFFGFIFYLFNVDLSSQDETIRSPLLRPKLPPVVKIVSTTLPHAEPPGGWSWNDSSAIDWVSQHLNSKFPSSLAEQLIPGPPFIFGACLVFIAILVILHLPSKRFGLFGRATAAGRGPKSHHLTRHPVRGNPYALAQREKEVPSYFFVTSTSAPDSAINPSSNRQHSNLKSLSSTSTSSTSNIPITPPPPEIFTPLVDNYRSRVSVTQQRQGSVNNRQCLPIHHATPTLLGSPSTLARTGESQAMEQKRDFNGRSGILSFFTSKFVPTKSNLVAPVEGFVGSSLPAVENDDNDNYNDDYERQTAVYDSLLPSDGSRQNVGFDDDDDDDEDDDGENTNTEYRHFTSTDEFISNQKSDFIHTGAVVSFGDIESSTDTESLHDGNGRGSDSSTLGGMGKCENRGKILQRLSLDQIEDGMDVFGRQLPVLRKLDEGCCAEDGLDNSLNRLDHKDMATVLG